MPVTAKTIARELQLSQPTVSRILSGDPGHRVAAQTRQRVLETAQRLGYQPNAVARSLRRGRTGIIGLYTNHNYDARNDFLGTIIGALQRCCEARDLDLLLHSGHGDRSADAMFSKLRDGRIDGLILHANADDPLVALLSESPLPVVTVADRLPNLPAVTCDDAGGMHQIMAYFWERGLRRFAFLGPDQHLTSVERRQAAFIAEVERYNVPASDWSVLEIGEDNAEAAVDLLRNIPQPCAVSCWNDRTAYHLLRVCRARGIRVPEELAVAGFDGFQTEKIPVWDLVTAVCPWEDVAARALELLMTLVDASPETLSATEEVCLPIRMRLGNTV
ncbi:MAG: LacI family DNA-binding transcriptional regulator [Janthinobacterium lividum]